MGEIQPEVQMGEYSWFPLEGVTGTSSYHFEYNLHLIKIYESIYTRLKVCKLR